MSASKFAYRVFSSLVILAMLFGMGSPALTPAVQAATPSAPPQPKAQPQTPAIDPLTKLHPDLRSVAQTSGPNVSLSGNAPVKVVEPIVVEVILEATQNPAITALFVDGKVITRPFIDLKDTKTQSLIGSILPSRLLKLASYSEVNYVIPMVMSRNGEPDNKPTGDEATSPAKLGPADWAALRAKADTLRATAKPANRVLPPKDWFDAKAYGPHKAETAWARGFTGEGVTVAVNDDGIDMAHPDLMGTQKIITSGPYKGWPMVFSPFSMFGYALETTTGAPYISGMYVSMHYVDTSTVPTLTNCGGDCRLFNFTPWIDFLTPGMEHTYYISPAMSKSGVVHVGTHPDLDMRDYVWGEQPAVLVTDPNVAGVYDTVYFDLNDDYDFRNDQPLSRAVVDGGGAITPGSENNMIASLDLTGDGLADVSGGMLYFIADGTNGIPVQNWLYPTLPVPGNGNLIAISGGNIAGVAAGAYSHGTQCASNIVGQGVTNGLVPTNIIDRASGDPIVIDSGVVGMAPDAKVVNVSDIYYNFDASKIDAFIFGAVGYDGCTGAGKNIRTNAACIDTDAIQVTSNSYGGSSTFNDGWELDGQIMSQIQRKYAPSLQYTKSTGNGGPGFGTTTPAQPSTGIMVGASTLFGSTGWDNYKYSDQINYNDITPFSDRGPSARGGTGVDVVADGAFGGGAVKLNTNFAVAGHAFDGNYAWNSWGGTSRSAPVAAGVLALLYNAYQTKNGVWPTSEVAKAIYMSTSTDLNYDVFTQGAGSVNADRGTAVAGGLYGVWSNTPAWTPGDFRGTNYPAFAHVVEAGENYTKQITLTNPSAAPITVDLVQGNLKKMSSVTFDWTLTRAMFAAKSANNSRRSPQFIIPLGAKPTSVPDTDATWSAWWKQYLPDGIPANADMMVVRMAQPYDTFDRVPLYTSDFRTRMLVYDWADDNADHNVWQDANANGAVNFTSGTTPVSIDNIVDINWATAEVDRYEYVRYAYSYTDSTTQQVEVHNPFDRMHDGAFIGLYLSGSATVDVTYKFQVEFYEYEATPWLSILDAAGTALITSLAVPAGGTAVFTAKVAVPADMPTGDYEAAIKVYDPGTDLKAELFEEHTTAIPVTLNVVAAFDGTTNLTLGGAVSKAYNADDYYNNALVRGFTDWGWREESGDWRFFYLDVVNPTTVIPILEEAFEGTIPPTGWVRTPASGNNTWISTADSGSANVSGGTGEAVEANSDYYGPGGMTAALVTPAMDLTGLTNPVLTFRSDFNDFAGTDDGYVYITTNDGGAWTELLHYDGVDMRTRLVTIPLSTYIGSTVKIKFTYVAAGWDWWWQIDDFLVADTFPTYGTETKLLVKDTWEDTEPYKNDIDTIILGPTQSLMGTKPWTTAETAYYGPYVLDTVGKSPDIRSGRAIWNYNTSSGRNEDWVMATASLTDGLYRLLQHNVLFEGLTNDIMFTKTVGLVQSAPDSIKTDTYVDEGVAGTITFKSTMDLSGLTANGYGLGGPMTFTDVPLPYNGSATLNFTKAVTIAHGAKIEYSTSSSNISDIDLLLYYCGPSGTSCSQKASSAGGTSDEHVMVLNPADGVWLMAVDNYSGPAGTFNYVETIVQGNDLTVTGLPVGPLAANTEATLTVLFNKPGMVPGTKYEGLILLGSPDAPALMQIPVVINRLVNSAKIDKKVDYTTTFAGDTLNYTVNLFNMSDAAATFDFSDPIPANTSYVPGTVTGGATYDAVNNKIAYNGPLALSAAVVEGFEANLMPPAGWTVVDSASTENWGIDDFAPHAGTYNATVLYDAALVQQNDWLLSPVLSGITGGEALKFWSNGSVYWCRDTYDNCDLRAWLVVGAPGGADDVLLGKAEADWLVSWAWAESSFNLPATLPAGSLRIGFQYYGLDGAQASLDDVTLPGAKVVSSKTITFQVKVDEPLPAGTSKIDNIASLTAKHDMPSGLQVEAPVTATASSAIGTPAAFASSWKEGPDKAKAGDILTYVIHVKNTGDEAALLTLEDNIPTNTTFKDLDNAIPNANFYYDGTMVTWTGMVAPGEEHVFTYRVTVKANVWGYTIVNTAALKFGASTVNVTKSTLVPAELWLPMIVQNVLP